MISRKNPLYILHSTPLPLLLLIILTCCFRYVPFGFIIRGTTTMYVTKYSSTRYIYLARTKTKFVKPPTISNCTRSGPATTWSLVCRCRPCYPHQCRPEVTKPFLLLMNNYLVLFLINHVVHGKKVNWILFHEKKIFSQLSNFLGIARVP